MDTAAVADIQDTLADLLADGENPAGLPGRHHLESLSPEATDRFRRHLQVKRLKRLETAQPASVRAATLDRSFTEIAAQFWRRCPPKRLPFADAVGYEADSWTGFLGASGIAIGAPWLPDLSRYERERYRALLRADRLGPPASSVEAAPAITGDDRFALSDYSNLSSFDFDVIQLHRHFCADGEPSSPPSSIEIPSQRCLSFTCTSPREGVHVSTVGAGTARLIYQLLRGSSVVQALAELGHFAGGAQFTRGLETVRLLFAAGLLHRRPAESARE
jgi:hypothetical protein